MLPHHLLFVSYFAYVLVMVKGHDHRTLEHDEWGSHKIWVAHTVGTVWCAIALVVTLIVISLTYFKKSWNGHLVLDTSSHAPAAPKGIDIR